MQNFAWREPSPLDDASRKELKVGPGVINRTTNVDVEIEDVPRRLHLARVTPWDQQAATTPLEQV